MVYYTAYSHYINTKKITFSLVLRYQKNQPTISRFGLAEFWHMATYISRHGHTFKNIYLPGNCGVNFDYDKPYTWNEIPYLNLKVGKGTESLFIQIMWIFVVTNSKRSAHYASLWFQSYPINF